METVIDQDERDEILRRFRAAPGVESVGQASGRRILQILGKPEAALTEDDYRHMRKVAGYVARHLKQRPLRDVTNTRWRWSLMNWGHDPLK